MIVPCRRTVVLSHAAAGHSASRAQWGDLATWATAGVAFLALISALWAYGKLSEQVKLQRQQLADQKSAGTKLAEQVDLQRQALADQQQANAKQAEVLEAEVRDLRQRSLAVERQQADAITLTPSRWRGRVPGVRPGNGPAVHKAVVHNGGHRPIRNVACRIQASSGDAVQPACLVARRAELSPSAISPPGDPGYVLVDVAEDSKLGLVRAGETAELVFDLDAATNEEALITLRFTDDADLHWQIDHDLHLEQVPNRDNW